MDTGQKTKLFLQLLSLVWQATMFPTYVKVLPLSKVNMERETELSRDEKDSKERKEGGRQNKRYLAMLIQILQLWFLDFSSDAVNYIGIFPNFVSY
jgi:hypothetical protein